jgi:hypothetical protein
MFDKDFVDWVIKGIVAASFAGWAMVIRYFGQKYIATQEEIQKELAQINTRLAVMETRLSALEDK